MNCSLSELFSQIYSNSPAGKTGKFSGFNNNLENTGNFITRKYEKDDIDFLNAYFSRGFNVSVMNGEMRSFFELSFNAFDTALHAWLSELPVERQAVSYGRKIIAGAVKEIQNRLDPDALAVINASSKVQREVHRMMGLLRFSPDSGGGFSAKCEPDHFILPCLGGYFTSRFAGIPWAVHDVKRNLSLSRRPPRKAEVHITEGIACGNTCGEAARDEWEDLWKHYHKTVNNEDRDNPGLQRQLMPQRYWKYLPEK
jgi:probable DNA metabolism protein